ncbi:MAG: zinc-dependent peptidase [Bacteroidales bacterium]|nr:zinc-dependent peptidase [Bacteroidales bacterium]
MNIYLTFFGIVALCAYLLYRFYWKSEKWIKPKGKMKPERRKILTEKVNFYNSLTQEEKELFEFKVLEFLANCRITGIGVAIDDVDKVLVASSAIIPIFSFPHWRYQNLAEVLLYPSSFNHKFETSGEDTNILGMVGSGIMEGKMILSKPALLHGFANESDKKNTAIHEFVHLIDKSDGQVDGVPALLLEKQYTIPWIDMINKKIDDIYEGMSDINPYGATNRAEFFSVISEYFFERPRLLSKNHPELYRLLEEIFNHDMNDRDLDKKKSRIGRNDPCPCNSGKKFKKCCGKAHF